MQKLWWHISFLIASCFIPTVLMAQKTAIPTSYKGFKDSFPVKAVNDTIDAHFDSATATLYASPNGGFLSGNSGYHESHKAQFFDASSTKPYTVYGFIYWFGYKKQESANADSSLIDLLFYQLDSSTTINNVSYLIPKTVFETKQLLVQDIDTSATYTSGANVWMLNEPKATTFPFAGAISLQGLNAADTIALYTSTDGDAPVANKSWERWGNYWHPIQSNWGVKVDFAIFPIVEIPDSVISVNEVFSNVTMQVYPNPAQELLNVQLNTKMNGKLDIMLLDMTGKVIYQAQPGNVEAGTHALSVPVQSLANGTYLLSIGVNQKNRVTKKVVIVH